MKRFKRLLSGLMTFVLIMSFDMPVKADSIDLTSDLSEKTVVDQQLTEDILPSEDGRSKSTEDDLQYIYDLSDKTNEQDDVCEQNNNRNDNSNDIESCEGDASDEQLQQLIEEAEKIAEAAEGSGGYGRGSKKADVVFVIDRTASMSGEIASVKTNLAAFVNYLAEKGLTLRFGIITYQDITADSADSTEVHRSGLSGSTWYMNAADTISELGSITVDGGGDDDETPIEALGYLIDDTTYNWSNNATRCAIVLTDAGYKYNNSWGFPKASSDKTDKVAAMNEVAEELAKRNIVTSVITGTYEYSEYENLVNTTGGILGDISSDFLQILKDMADNILNFAAKEKIGVYVIPGYLGSQLYSDEDDEKVWLDIPEVGGEVVSYALSGSTEGLLLSRDAQGGSGRVHADNSEDAYGTQDTYEALIKYLEDHLDPDKYSVKFFPYDWLGDINDSVIALEQDIKVSGYDKIILVTHSTGGLLASAYVAKSEYNRAQIERVVLVAPPLYGTYTALEPLLYGITGSLNKTFDNTVLVSSIVTNPSVIIPAGVVIKAALKKWVKGSLKNTPTTYQLLPSEEYLRLMPQCYNMLSAVTSIDEYYSILNEQSDINSTLVNGNSRSHKAFREGSLHGDVLSVLNKVDTTLIGNSYCTPTPAIAMAYKGLFSKKHTIPEIIYKKDGDGTVMGVSALLRPVSGIYNDGIKRIDLSEGKGSVKDFFGGKCGPDHTDMVKDEESIKVICDAVLGETGSETYGSDYEPEWSVDDVYTLENAELSGMSDMAKIILYNNQDTYFEVIDADGNVRAKIDADEDVTFDGFTYNDLSDGTDHIYQLQLPRRGYKINIYNSTASAPDGEVAVATMDRGGFRKTTATYEMSTFVDSDAKLIAVIDLTEELTDENVDDIVAGSGLIYEKTENTAHDWTFKDDEIRIENIGETRTLEITGPDAGKINRALDIIWESSDEDVVTVSEGNIKTENYGDAYIYATAKDGSGKVEICHIIVAKYPTDVSLGDLSMTLGSSIKPSPRFTPEDANMTEMTYESDDQSIVRIINGSTLKAVGLGIVEVTGTTVNGLKASFMITVRSSDSLYVDDVAIDPAVAVLKKNQESTVVARIVPETALNKSVSWNIADPSVATLSVNADNSCTIVGHNEGVTQLSAISDDGSYTDEATVVVGNILDVESDHRIVIKKDNSKQLVLRKGGVLYPVYKAESTNSEVVKVSATGMLTAKNSGSVLVSLYGRSKGTEASAVLQVSVARDLSEDVLGVSVASPKVESNIYRKTDGYVKFDINLKDAGSSITTAEFSNKTDDLSRIALAVDAASFTDENVRKLFELEPYSDNTLKLKPIMDTSDESVKALKKSYSSAIKLVIDGKEYTTNNKVEIVINKKKPVIRPNAVTLNSFYPDDKKPFTFKTDCGTVAKIALDGTAIPAGLKLYADEIAVGLTGDTVKSGNNVMLLVRTDEIRSDIPVKVAVKVTKTVPPLKLSTSSIKVCKDISYSKGQKIYLVTKSKKDSLGNYNIAGISLVPESNMTVAESKKYKINGLYSLTDYDPEDGSFLIKTKGNSGIAVGGPLLVQVNMYGTKQKLKLNLAVSVVAKPKARFSKTRFTFNSNYLGSITNYSTFTITPCDYNTGKLKTKITKPDGSESDDISASIKSDRVVIKPKESANGVYKVRVYDGVIENILTVQVKKLYGVKPSVATSGAVDITINDKFITLTPSIRNLECDKSSISLVLNSVSYTQRISRRSYKVIYATDAFSVSNMGNGKSRLTLNTLSDSYRNGYVIPGSYSAYFSVYAAGKYIGSISKKISVKCSKPKMVLNTKNIELSSVNVSVPVALSASLTNADPSVFEWKISGNGTGFANVREIGPGKFAIELDNVFAGKVMKGKLEVGAYIPGTNKVIIKQPVTIASVDR